MILEIVIINSKFLIVVKNKKLRKYIIFYQKNWTNLSITDKNHFICSNNKSVGKSVRQKVY